MSATTVEYGQEGEEEEYDYEFYEDGMSGDYEMQFPQGMGVKAAVFSKSLFKICFSFLTFHFSPLFSCHVKQTQRPFCHPGG